MNDIFNFFSPLSFVKSGTVAYNPLINYDWSTTTTGGLRYLKDIGSTPSYDASLYFGRGAYLNGVDQTITVPINTTIQTAFKRVNGVVTISETSQTLTNYVISGLGVHKDYYLFTRLLTTAEKDSYTNTPELFYAMAQADSTCVLNMPMCETSSTVRNYKTGIDYPITNYTSSVRDNAKNLQYGLQTCKFKRDSLGVIQSASTYLECDGVGYGDTGWIPSADEDWSISMLVPKGNTSKTYNMNGTNSEGGNDRVLVGTGSNGDYCYLRIGSYALSSQAVGTYDDYYHALISYDSVNSKAYFYINGEFKTVRDITFLEPISSFGIGAKTKSDGSLDLNETVEGAIPYFNVKQELITRSSTEMEEYIKARPFNIVAHSGFKKYAPENTMRAFTKAIELGCRYLETDVCVTLDGHLVLSHDTTIDRTSNGTGNIADMTLAELQTYDFGSWYGVEFSGEKIVTLEEFCELARNNGCYICPEIKNLPTDADKDKYVEIIENYNLDNKCFVFSSSFGNAWYCYNQNNNLIPSHVNQTTGANYYWSKINKGGWVANRTTIIANPELMADARKYGVTVFAYTTVNEDEIKELMDLGVTHIISDLYSDMTTYKYI